MINYCFFFSDDRSADVFRKMLESSTEMHSVLTTNSKPNCLIIDEIDGAPAVSGFDYSNQTVQALCQTYYNHWECGLISMKIINSTKIACIIIIIIIIIIIVIII